jgi:hypothetical protein
MTQYKTKQISQVKLLQDGKGFTYDNFKFDTVIVESETGTGKTYTICEHANKMIGENKELFMLSLTSKRMLADQHMVNMSKQITKKETVDYRRERFTVGKNFICCVNSLPKFFNLIEKNLENCILYIDEISAFCYDLTHNETIYDVKGVYECVKTLINKCFKLVVTQSEITDNVFELLKNRGLDFEYKKNETIMIKNSFKPNINKVAKFYFKNVEIFNKMLEDLKNNKPFLVSCDEKAEAKKIHEFILNHLQNTTFKKEDVLLCTADDKINLNEIENKICVYSPSITNAVNFDFPYKSNQYTFIKGNSITADLIYQQSMRTRNLENLHVYYGNIKKYVKRFETLDQCEEYCLNNASEYNKLIKKMSYLDENDNEQTIKIESSFNKLFFINEFNKELMKADVIGEYKKRLIKNGFDIEDVEGEAKNNDQILQELKEASINRKNIDDLELAKNVEIIKSNKLTSDNFEEYDEKIKSIIKMKELLNCEYDDMLEKNKKFIDSSYAYSNFMKINIFMMDDLHQKEYMHSRNIFNYDVKASTDDYYKTFLLSKLTSKYILGNDINSDDNINIDVEDKGIFTQIDGKNASRIKIQTVKDMTKFIKNRCDFPLFEYIHTKKGNLYKFNEGLLKLNIDNYITKYGTTNGISNVYLNMFGIEEVKAKVIDDFIDDEMSENINCIDTVL